ncbi:glycosyltransferase family 4 protein [Desulfobulbus propionicus]
MITIIHLTSVHSRIDTRIFHKMCCSLASEGFNVSLVLADGLGDAQCNNVHIYDVGISSGRFNRICNAPQRIFKKARSLDADLYHLHDPELLPIGLKLKQLGKKVVFDSHEDVPKQLMAKPYLNKAILWTISKIYSVYEKQVCRKLDGVVAATPYIRDNFLPINPNTVDINNFPLLDELVSAVPWENKKLEICYVGSIGKIRGLQEIVAAMSMVQSDVRLNLCGSFREPAFENTVKAMPGWSRVAEHGFVDRAGIQKVLSNSMAGLVTLHPVINYLDAQPVKMFEYMSAGIPVIASNFPFWRQIVEGNRCGLCVDPLNPQEIARAIDYLITHSKEACQMGNNGRRAVMEHYNWQLEEKKLLSFYQSCESVH